MNASRCAKALLHFICPLSLVPDFPCMKYYRSILQSKDVSIIILMIRTNHCCMILLLYKGLLHTVMTWIICFSMITCNSPATSDINHKHHAVDLFTLWCSILSIMIRFVMMLKSTIDPNGMPYNVIPDSSQRQQTPQFQ